MRKVIRLYREEAPGEADGGGQLTASGGETSQSFMDNYRFFVRAEIVSAVHFASVVPGPSTAVDLDQNAAHSHQAFP
jgi:hypothetical protein